MIRTILLVYLLSSRPHYKLLMQFLLCLDDDLYSHMIVVWGQYIDHDFDFTPQSLSTSTFQGLTNCKETCASSPPCFPIPVGLCMVVIVDFCVIGIIK